MRKQIKPRLASGFIEYLPEEQRNFDFIANKIRSAYLSHGYTNIDTPVLELADVLLSNSGGETEKQVYRFTKGDTDYAMRYDLTVPLSRYVVQHAHDLSFPFRRSQIQKVWRAEKAQKGRYREFFQCDVDVICKDYNLFYDAEIIRLAASTLSSIINTNFVISINNRKLVNSILSYLEISRYVDEILIIVDKLDKVGQDKVIEDLTELIKDQLKVERLVKFFQIRGDLSHIIKEVGLLGIDGDEVHTALNEFRQLDEYISSIRNKKVDYQFDLSIMRGLAYYTGMIFETKIISHEYAGSICSGGRYDNLCSNFTTQKLTGTGISIGLSRLFSIFKDTDILIKEKVSNRIAIIPVDSSNIIVSNEIADKIRNLGISAEVFVEDGSIGSKIKTVLQKGYEKAVIIGSDEISSKTITLKNLTTKNQVSLKWEEIITEKLLG